MIYGCPDYKKKQVKLEQSDVEQSDEEEEPKLKDLISVPHRGQVSMRCGFLHGLFHHRAGGWRDGGWVAGRMQGNMVNKLQGWGMADLMQWCHEEQMPKTAELIHATRFDGQKLVKLTVNELSIFDDRFEVGEPLFSNQMSFFLKLEKKPVLKRLRRQQPGLLFFVLSAALPIFCFLL